MLFNHLIEYSEPVMNTQQEEEQTHFNEIAEMLADGKITLEQACDLFKEKINEWQARENLVNSK